MVLYGVYYRAYKIANFYISAFSTFHWTSFYKGYSLMALYGVYFVAYKIGHFYISALSVFHHTSFYPKI